MKRFPGIALTLVLLGVIVVAISFVWDRYMYTPWTRDARLRAEVVDIAPDVSGWVSQLKVRNAEHVDKGETLFVIDREHYRIALELAQARLDAAHVAWQRAEEVYLRRQRMTTGDVSTEETVLARLDAAAKKTSWQQAQANLDAAALDLRRTVYSAPADGTLIDLNLEQGDYVTRGAERLALVKDHSLYLIGYFEESKLPRIHVGDKADIWLMAGSRHLHGHVSSMDAGIDNANITPGNELLPQVAPTFAWIRMAQRIPVNIRIDAIPPGIKLTSGMSATVRIDPQSKTPSTTLQGWKGIATDVQAAMQ